MRVLVDCMYTGLNIASDTRVNPVIMFSLALPVRRIANELYFYIS